MSFAGYKTGHIPEALDPSTPRYVDHPEMSGAALIGTDDLDLSDDGPDIRDQIAQDCCAHATSALLFTWFMTSGEPAPLASILAMYADAQLRARPKEPLVDQGCGLAQMFQGLKDVGFVLERDWPEIPENVNVIPPDDLQRDAEHRIVTSYHAIADGARTSEELKAALQRRRTSTVCFMVDEKFANIGADVYDIPGGRVIGSHAQLVTGYSSTLKAFKIRGSWGLDFGDLGYSWVSERFMNLHTYEKFVVDAARIRR